MVVPPFYDALSWRELLAHYTAVAERISIPAGARLAEPASAR